MSKDNIPAPQSSEEIDLIQLFKLIGNAFQKVIDFFGSIFKAIFSVFIHALRVVIDNYKLVIGAMLIATIIGYGLEKTKRDVYVSQMLVKPYFDSKYQLVTNINYYNALIADKDYDQLTNIFGVKEEDAKQILEFEIKPGPENENDRIKQYDNFVKSIDSLRAQDVSFGDFIENRSIYSGNIFEINVKSHKKDIFRSLEEGLEKTFTNAYSAKKMKKRDSVISIERTRILASLKEVDSLKKVYVDIKKEESQSSKKSFSTQDGLTYIEQRTDTKEYELLNKQISLRQSLSDLETQKVEEDEFFDTLSSFQEVGAKYSSIFERYSLIFPVLAFLILVFAYFIFNIIKYVKNYEG